MGDIYYNGVWLSSKGVEVYGDYDIPLLPEIKTITEDINGLGTIYVGSYFGPRVFDFKCSVEAENYDSLVAIGIELAALLDPSTGPKKLILSRHPNVYYEAVFTGKLDLKEMVKYGIFSLQFTCYDPWGHSEGDGIDDKTLTNPITFNITNKGDLPTRPIIGIAGSVTNLIIRNTTTSRSFGLNVASSALDQINIDMARMIVTMNAVNVINSIQENTDFWELIPGVNNIRFSSTTITGTPKISIEFTNNYR